MTDIDARMGAWHDATNHPERASEFLKAVFGDDETDEEVAEIAAEEGPDDFEAPGIKHMKDTKKERNGALKTLVDYTTMNKERVGQGAEIGAYVTGYDAAHDRDKLGNATLMDVDVDTSSYLEALLDRGLITPEQYAAARKRFKEGRDTAIALAGQ